MLTRLPIPETNTNDGISLLGNLFLQASTSSLNFQAIYQHRRESTPFGISFKINHKSEHVSVMFQIFVSSLVKLILLLPLILQTLFFFFFGFCFMEQTGTVMKTLVFPKHSYGQVLIAATSIIFSTQNYILVSLYMPS